MKKRIYHYFIILISVMTLSSCEKFVEDGNVNTDTNQASSVTLNTLLPSVAYSTFNNQGSLAYITTLFSQQMAAYSSGPSNEDKNIDVRIASAFSGFYLRGMTNAKILIDMANEQGAPYYSAIGRILLVANLSMTTDTWGSVPLSEAFQAPEILQPRYESQQDIYEFMQKYLDTAIAETDQTNPSTLLPASDDIVYAGSMTKWKQAAYFLKARLYMHLTKKGATDAANNALTALANGFTSSANDFQLIFSEKNPNPWFTNVSGRISGSAVFTIAPTQRFLDATVNGVYYPGLFDFRIPKLIAKSGSSSTYVGLVNGGGNTGTNNCDLRDTTFYAKRVSPLVIGSYGEQKLMEAEALFLANGGTTSSVGTTTAAYDAYLAGITADYSKLGLSASAYTSNPVVGVGEAALTLEHILREKQVVLFLNPEAWTDMRRYDYNTDLFKGVALPLNQSAEMNGQFIRRSFYPLEEIARNPNASGTVKLFEKIWWDE